MKTTCNNLSVPPLITIVTVCFNAANEIMNTLESVKSLQFTDYEHLLIDGQSTDNTIDIIKNFNNSKIRWVSEPDLGIYDAMNKGIKWSKGQFITFLNAGDYYHDEQALKHVADEINNGYELISGNFILNSINKHTLIHSDTIDLSTLKKRFEVCHQTIFVKNHNLPFYSLDYKIKADYKWVIDITRKLDKKKIKKIDRALVCYQDDGFSTASFYRNLKELTKLHYQEFGLARVFLNLYDYSKRAARSFKKFIMKPHLL